jgi:hypothetical protein
MRFLAGLTLGLALVGVLLYGVSHTMYFELLALGQK